MRYGEAARKLNAMGCQESLRKGGGSHRKWHNPVNGHLTVVPDWGARDLKTGTLRAIVKQFGLNWNSFLHS